MPSVLTLSLVAEASLHVPPELEWEAQSKDPSQGTGRDHHQKAGVTVRGGEVWPSWAPPTPRIRL